MTYQATSSSAHHTVRPDWLAQHEEQILEPQLPIVDPHHHLWDRPGNRYFAFDLLSDIASGHDVRATVAVEAGAMYKAEGASELAPIGETEFLNGQAAISASGGYGPCR
ncbi:MAG TPA: amidohydrolase, partial [Burkholderiales bacterium]|nr:amidohydrolase [Burkholderiales bacterium]